MKPSLIIFDFDGVLVDTPASINKLEWEFLKNYGLKKSLPEYTTQFSGKTAFLTLQELQKERIIQTSLDVFNLAKKMDDFVLEKLLKEPILPIKGVRPMLTKLPLKKCVASNCSFSILKCLLISSGLAASFEGAVFASDMVKNPKPSPDLFLFAAKEMGVPPFKCLVIEASPVGVQAAIQAKMTVWGFLGASHIDLSAKEKLLQLGAERTFSHMEKLPQLLETEKEEPLFSQLRQEMVNTQLIGRGIHDARVLKAMSQIKRHLFVPKELKEKSYMDFPLPIGHDQTISQPYIVALMCQLAQIGPDDRVLEIGTGSGYQAAILSKLARSVYTIEIVRPLGEKAKKVLKKEEIQNVHVKIGDGYFGWEEHQPYDAILITAECDEVPQHLVKQLKTGGRLVMPLQHAYQTQLVRFTKEAFHLKKETFNSVRFVPFQRLGKRAS
jgi:protein-L-isoaspartate(D-aspartate) O-methyltransferase